MHSQLMTVTDVAEMLAVHPNTIRSRAHDGVIPGARIGKLWRFWRPTVLALAVGDEAAEQLIAADGYRPDDDPEVVSPAALGELLGINRATVRAAIHRGAIPTGRVMSRQQISWPYVRDAIAAGTALEPSAEPAEASE